jgi:hypothetical protein
MMQSLLSALLIVGLIGSGDLCAWLCLEAAVSIAAEADTPCQNDCASKAPSPCEDSCSTCSLEIDFINASGTAAADVIGRVPVEINALAFGPSSPAEQRAQRRTAHKRTASFPARDTLALTTILQV